MKLEIDWDYQGNKDNRIHGRLLESDLKRIFKITQPITIKIQYRNRKIIGSMYDLSAGGISIEILEDIPINTNILINFRLDHYRIQVEGKILHKKDLQGSWRYGIIFKNLDEMTSEILKGLFISKTLMFRR